MSTPAYWTKAKTHLSKADPVMGKIIRSYKGEILKARGDGFHTLARSIIGQQISVKAADSVWEKLVRCSNSGQSQGMQTERYQHHALGLGLRRDDVDRLTDQQLRSCGLSAQKVAYLRAIAGFFEEYGHAPDWPEDHAELVVQLTSIKGVGVWTAEMFMIFHLLKPDILPVGDLGLLKAIGLHYLDDQKATKEQAEKIAEPWRPYRSVATWYLWRSLDPVAVAY